MAYIEKLVMNGFKSFGRKTEIVFDKGISTVVGPNGSGKSNISDALCFVLGRISAKSMRASQAKNLIFMGSKFVKPAKEASVELIFNNSDKAFALDREQIHLTRIVRRNGQSIYKINGETKTRTEILEMLAQAGIDPHGFNLILQGQIQSIVRMHPEDRRKIIEEVAGISIYESRKEKSLHELEKTEEKLKEISAILRERTAYLKNLDRERQQALRFKELELTVKRAKATILSKKSDEKDREIKVIVKSIEEKTGGKDKKKESIFYLKDEIEKTNEKINEINKHIQQASGVEQETLRTGIADLRAELEGLRVRRENFENKRDETERRIHEMEKSIPELEQEIGNLKKKSPLMARKAGELKKKKDELLLIEEERKKLLAFKTELAVLKERMKDKEKQLIKVSNESQSLLNRIEEDSRNLKYRDEKHCLEELNTLKESFSKNRSSINDLNKKELENEKISSISETEIERARKIKEDVSKIDLCPLCQSKITGDHIEHVHKDSDSRIQKAKEDLENAKDELKKIDEERREISEEINKLERKKTEIENELIVQRTISSRKHEIKKSVEEENLLKKEIKDSEEKRRNLELKILDLPKIEDKYSSKMLEIEEISSRTEEDVDTTLLYKQREVENISNVIKRGKKDLEEIGSDIDDLESGINDKSEQLEDKEEQEKQLNQRFKKMFAERDSSQKEIQEKNLRLSEMQNEVMQIEDQINYLKVGKAKLDAEREAVVMELSEFTGVELMQAPIHVLEEKIKKSQEQLHGIGSINMRALEVYEEMKKEYDLVQEKVDTLDKEKTEILKIVEEIDKKKKYSFMKSFRAVNELFTKNFSQLYAKGVAYLEIENKEDIFAGGINIVVKLSKGKYFDVTSLSGGEQTLVALSLLFAIQEYKPYHFYIFDEIDAALDKRNSERLSALLDKYMKAGQYIVITHNDAIIMNSNVLYGVSMHEGISKILSLKI